MQRPARWLFLLCLLPQLLAAGEPPTKAFPRIEAGQHGAPIRHIGVDGAGRWLVTASDDKSARVWDLESGELVRVLRPPVGDGNEGKLFAAALSPDGRTVALGGWTGVSWRSCGARFHVGSSTVTTTVPGT